MLRASFYTLRRSALNGAIQCKIQWHDFQSMTVFEETRRKSLFVLLFAF